MSVIILLLLISFGIAGIFLIAFLWSVNDGQFDDDYSPPRRILFDDKAGSREQGAGSREQGAGSREQGAGSNQ